MTSQLSILSLFTTRRALASRMGLLTVAAYAVTTAIFLVVIGGTWAFFGWSAADVGGEDDFVGLYRILAVFAVILLLIPAANVSAAAAKLSARRNDRRLSTLSLLGASPATVRQVAIGEPLVLSFLGVAAGSLASLALLAPLSLIRFQGAPLGYTNMLLPWWGFLAVAAGLMVLSIISAALGLRRVTVSPLGVRLRQHAQAAGWARMILGAGLLAVAVITSQIVTDLDLEIGVVVGMVFAVVAAGLFVLTLVGGWFAGAVGRVAANRAQTPEAMIAAKIVTDVPKQSWQRVSGLSMTCFAAVFLGAGAAIMNAASSAEGLSAAERAINTDIRTGLLLTVAIAFVLIGASAVIHQWADILDRADLYAGLHALGMDDAALKRLSVRTVTLPLFTAIGFGVLAAGMLAFPLVGGALLFAPLSMVACLAVCALGAVLVWSAVKATARTVPSTLEMSRAVT